MTVQPSLFTPIAQIEPVASPLASRPFGRCAAWRAPTRGEYACAHPGCGCACGFGLGDRWFCREHLPADYLPAARVAA